jgi:hypothetical protein
MIAKVTGKTRVRRRFPESDIFGYVHLFIWALPGARIFIAGSLAKNPAMP